MSAESAPLPGSKKRKHVGAMGAAIMGFAEVFREHFDTESVEVMEGAGPSNDDIEVSLDENDPSKSVIRIKRG